MLILLQGPAQPRAADLQHIGVRDEVLSVQGIGQGAAHVLAVLDVHALGFVDVGAQMVVRAFLYIFHVIDGYAVCPSDGL